MTSKQRAIWHEVQKYWRRSKRDTLARIAAVVGCSKATVSRFLRRLDLWRFINLATIRGHGGGTYIFTRKNPYDEKPQRWTESRRARLRALLAARVKREQLRELYANIDVQYTLQTLHERLGPKPKPSRVVVRVQLSSQQMTISGDAM
jgi:transcriptional regulator with XRE-family HTH domain